MRTHHRSAWILAAFLALAGTGHAASPSADEAAIRAQSVSWAKAYNGGDAAGVAAQYTDDALLMPPGAPAVRGRAAIQAFFAKDVAASHAAGVVFNLDPHTDVGVAGDTGWESGTYTATIKGKLVESGKFLSVSRKQGGTWHYIRDTWNADASPAAPADPKK